MSRRAAIWSAAALSLIFVLLLSAALWQPVLGGAGDDNRDGVVTADAWSELTGSEGGWDDEYEGDEHEDDEYGDDEHEDDEHEDDEHEDDDDN